MKNILVILFYTFISFKLLAQNCTVGNTGDVPTNDEYVLIWADEFDSDGAVCSDKWHHQTQLIAGDSWANGERQHYTDEITNSFVDDGFLTITAKKESYFDQGVTKDYTSARLNSKFAFTYGKVEVRAKLPEGIGTWPAIWLLGTNINEDGGYWDDNIDEVNWPACGEIDVMEHWGDNQNVISSALHTPSSFGGTVNYGSTVGSDVSNTFHVYSMIWDENQIEFSMDGVPFYTYNPATKNDATWPFYRQQYLLLNVAIAANVVPEFVESSMVIDYVRVYQNYDEDPSDNAPTLEEQTITFNALPDKTLGNAPFNVTATASSGLDVTFSSASNEVTLNGNQVTLLEAGSVTIDADQGGDATYGAAPTVSQTFCINPMKPSVSTDGNNYVATTLSSSNNDGNQWFLDGVPIDGETNSTIVTSFAGLYSVQTTVEGCVSEMSEDFEVLDPADLTPQTITFTTIADKTFSDDPFTLSATTSSGLDVVYSTFSTELSIVGSTVTMLRPGTVVIIAEQPGNEEFLPAEPVTQIFCVNPPQPTITESIADSGIILESSSEEGNRWYLNGNIIANERGQNLSVEENGIYTVQVTIDGCSSLLSEERSSIITSLDSKEHKMRVFPNPATNTIQIYGHNLSESNIKLSDASGKALPITFKNSGESIIADISQLKNGLYILQIHGTNGVRQFRILKK